MFMKGIAQRGDGTGTRSAVRGHLRLAAVLLLLGLLLGCGTTTKEDLLQKAHAASEKGNLNGAVVYLKNALEKDPAYVDARLELAKVLVRLGKLDKAEAEYAQLIAEGHADAKAKLEDGRLLLALDKAAEAEKLAEELISGAQSADDQAAALALRGNIKTRRGDISSAMQDYQAALEKNPKNVDALVALARFAMAKGDPAEARKRLEAAVQADTKSIPAFETLARLEYGEGHMDAALQAMDKALEINPRNLPLLYRKATLFMDRHDVDSLRTLVASMQQFHPNAPETLRARGVLLYFDGKDNDAAPLLNKAQESQPAPEGFYYLGLVYMRKGDLETAVSMLRKQLDIAPNFIPSRVLISRIFLQQRRIDQAVLEAQMAVKIQPRSPQAHLALGSALVASGKIEQGLKEVTSALDENPELAEANVLKGLVELRQGKLEQGEQSLRKAIAADPENLENRMLLFTQFLRQRQFDKAKDLMKDALKGGPGDAIIYNIRSVADVRAGNLQAGLDELQKAKDADPKYQGTYTSRALLFVSLREMDKAEAELRALLQMQPDDPQTLFQLAGLLHLAGKEDASWAELDKAWKHAPQNLQLDILKVYMDGGKADKAMAAADQLAKGMDPIQGTVVRIRTLVGLNKLDAAAELAEQLRKSNPPLAATVMGDIRLRQKNYPEAEAEAHKLVAATSESVESLLNLARVYAEENKDEQSLEVLNGIYAKDPKNINALVALGTQWAVRKDFDKASKFFKEIVAAQPDSALGYYQQGMLRELQGDTEGAKSFYYQAIGRDGNYVSALNNLSYLLAHESGQEKAALALAAQAYQVQPRDAAVMDSLGFALIQNNRAAEAVNLLKQAAEMNKNPSILYHLGLAYSKTGQAKEAKEALAAALQLGDFKEAPMARKLSEDL